MRISDWSSDVCSSDLDWLLRWFNPRPTLLGPGVEDREWFYALARYPDETEEGEIELASGRDFSQRLFFGQPRSDVAHGTWHFDGMPHRVLITDRLRMPPDRKSTRLNSSH